MDVILIGSPGTGKGTQSMKLSQTLHIRHISSGDLFRKAFDEKTDLGLRAQTYIDLGELVPDDLTVSMMRDCIEEPESANGVLLDGFPRTLAQAQELDTELQHLGRKIDLAISLSVPREELLKRFAGRLFCHANQHVYHVNYHPPKVEGVCDLDGSELYQRSDDKGEALRRRLVVFFSQVNQLLDYYRKQNKLHEVDGNQSIDQVYQQLLQIIYARA